MKKIVYAKIVSFAVLRVTSNGGQRGPKHISAHGHSSWQKRTVRPATRTRFDLYLFEFGVPLFLLSDSCVVHVFRSETDFNCQTVLEKPCPNSESVDRHSGTLENWESPILAVRWFFFSFLALNSQESWVLMYVRHFLSFRNPELGGAWP